MKRWKRIAERIRVRRKSVERLADEITEVFTADVPITAHGLPPYITIHSLNPFRTR